MEATHFAPEDVGVGVEVTKVEDKVEDKAKDTEKENTEGKEGA